MKKIVIVRALRSASVAALAIAGAASAQTATQTRSGPVDRGVTQTGDTSQSRVPADPTAAATTGSQSGVADIVVTAERREASLQTVPIPVTALSATRLTDSAVSAGNELERFVPSLKMSPNITTPTNLSPSLRGSGTQDASLTVAESPFGIYIDDVFVGRLNGNNTTLADVERVEVLRGPQGTLYGRNTLAGAIKFVTRVPGERTWAEARVGYGSYNEYLVAGSAGGPLNAAGLAASASFQFNGRKGYGRNLATGQRIGNEDNFAGRAKLRYSGSAGLDVTASVSYTDSRNDAAILVPFTTTVAGNRQATSNQILPKIGYYDINVPLASYAAAGPVPIGSRPSGKTQQFIGSLNAAYDFGDVVLKSITAYVDTKDYFTTDFGGTGAIIAGTPSHSRQFTEELQLLGTGLDGKLNYILGAFYLDERASQDFGWFFILPASQTFSTNRTESIAGFGQATYELADGLKLTAGLRYTRDTKRFNIRIVRQPTALVPAGPQPPVAFDLSYDAWTPKFGIGYEVPTGGGFFDKLLIYASAARGFRSGGFNGINIFNLDDARTPYFPETNWTYEGGFKADVLDRRLRVNANYFIDDIGNLLLNATVAGGTSFPVQNSGSARIQGLELEISAVPVDGLNLFANASFLDGKFKAINPTSAPAQAVASYGVAVPQTPQTPKATYTIGFDYTAKFAMGGTESALRFGGDYYRSGSYTNAATNDLIIDAYDRLNGFVALEFGKHVEARMTVKNIENDRSFITGSRALGGFIALPPRTFMFTLGYKM